MDRGKVVSRRTITDVRQEQNQVRLFITKIKRRVTIEDPILNVQLKPDTINSIQRKDAPQQEQGNEKGVDGNSNAW
jgi:hypothetical protein